MIYVSYNGSARWTGLQAPVSVAHAMWVIVSQPQREDGKSQGVCFSLFYSKGCCFQWIFKYESFKGPHINLLKASRKMLPLLLLFPPSGNKFQWTQMLHIFFSRLPGFSCPTSTLAKPPVLELETGRTKLGRFFATRKSKNKQPESHLKFYLLDWSPVVIMLYFLQLDVCFWGKKRRTGNWPLIKPQSWCFWLPASIPLPVGKICLWFQQPPGRTSISHQKSQRLTVFYQARKGMCWP